MKPRALTLLFLLALVLPVQAGVLGTTRPWWNPLLFEFRGRRITFQGQVPWLLAPWLIYGGVIFLARKSGANMRIRSD